jgi:hypothetical protein
MSTTTTTEDITVSDVDAFLRKLRTGAISAEDVHAMGVALNSDDPTIDPTALRRAFEEKKDLLAFLCGAPPTVVNAVTNNALFGEVGAGKGVLLRDFMCYLAAQVKENGGTSRAMTQWEERGTDEKVNLLDSWKGTLNA